jgi:hypothetical protein
VGLGEMKCGTTALWDYIIQHPDVYYPQDWLSNLGAKEPNFFNSTPQVFEESPIKYQSWSEVINQAPLNQKICDMTVHYLEDDVALERIKQHSPNAKLFAVLRNPIDRVYSQWNWNNNTTLTHDVWSERIETTIIDGKYPLENFGKSIYSPRIKKVHEIFGKEQVHFIKYENYKKDNFGELEKLFNHLELDPHKYNYKHRVVLHRPYVEPLSKHMRNLMLENIIKEIEQVETLLNWDCSDWKI